MPAILSQKKNSNPKKGFSELSEVLNQAIEMVEWQRESQGEIQTAQVTRSDEAWWEAWRGPRESTTHIARAPSRVEALSELYNHENHDC